MDKIPLVDLKTGRLNFEWVYCYSKENNCDVIAAFREGMNQLGNLYIQLKDFQQKFLESPREMLREYEVYCGGQHELDRRLDARRQTPNKNAPRPPVICD